MSRQNGIGLCVDADGFSFMSARRLSRLVTIFVVAACSNVMAAESGWLEKDRSAQIDSARIGKSAQLAGDGKLVAKSVKVVANVPVAANKPTRHHRVAANEADKEDELNANTARIWAMLLIAILLVSLRIRGSMARSNKVY